MNKLRTILLGKAKLKSVFRSETTKTVLISDWSMKKYRESVANVLRIGFSDWLKIK